MPNSTTSSRRSSRRWQLPVIISTATIIGGVFGNIIAPKVEGWFGGDYYWLIWVIFAVTSLITIIITIRESRRENEAASPANEPAASPYRVNLKAQGDLTARDVVGRDKIVDKSISVGDLQNVSGVAIGEKANVTIIQQAALPAFQPLHQLPTPPRDFTGREAELNELLAKMESGGVTISGLQGMGGIGKTALALKLAERLAPRYPDAQFFLDLKSVSDTPLVPAEAMAHVIRAYHPTAKLPESETELKPLYQSVLHGQRALLLMDNARDAQQVLPLLPPATCLLLVTSRQHFTLPGLYAKDLNTLPPNEAGQLLLTIAPRIGAAAETMAKLCGYLPQALRLAASALAEQIDLSPADYLARLEDAQTRLDLVEASLSLSYDLLDAETQKCWRRLAVFPDTFDQPAGAALWEMAVEPAQKILSALVKYSLVEWQPQTRRYRLHDLARLFAAKQCPEPERAAGQQRHAEHYATVLSSADDLYLEGGEATQRGLALFDLEWGNIQAGQAWAKQNADKNRQALELCDDYTAWGYMIFDLRQHPRERIDWLEAALKAARKLGRKQSEGWHLGNLGNAYAALGEPRRAIEFYEQRLKIAREIGDRRGEGAAALGNLGLAYADLGEPRRAIEFYEQALVIDREIGDRRGEGADLFNLSLAQDQLGERKQAIANAEAALKIREQIEDPNAAKVRRQLEKWRG